MSCRWTWRRWSTCASRPSRVEALAAEPSVRQVRAPAGWTPTMNVAHDAVGANWTDSKGFTGGGVVVGIVEYTRVDYSRPGLSGARLDSYRVSSTGLSCPHSRGEYNNSSAISHVSWAAAIAVGRGSTYKGIANGARLVDVSADFNPTSDAADPRILKAVDCAIVQGGAHLITMSLVQNDASTYSTSNAYFDAVVWDHHRLIVGNGGNNYSETNSHCPGSTERVRSPGSAWNVLSVGGTTNGAGRLWYRASGSEPAYCWEDPPGHSGDVNDRVKPELVGAGPEHQHVLLRTAAASRRPRRWSRGSPRQLLDQRAVAAELPRTDEGDPAGRLGGEPRPDAGRQPEHQRRGPRDGVREMGQPDRREATRRSIPGATAARCSSAASTTAIARRSRHPGRRLRGAVHDPQGPLRHRLDGPHRTRPNPRSGSTFTQRYADFNLDHPQGRHGRRQLDPQRLQRRMGRFHRRDPRSRASTRRSSRRSAGAAPCRPSRWAGRG